MKANNFSIVFVGTSSGKTSLTRFHSSLFITSSSFNLLIDCGDGTSKALLARAISTDSIDGILFSHLHPDHSAGFPSLIVQMKQQKRNKKLKIFCHKNLIETLKRFLYQTFVFTERSSFEIEYCEFEHDNLVVVTDNFNFVSKQNSHLNEYVDYLNEKKTGFACSSFLIMLGRNKIYYSGDVGSEKDLYLFDDRSPEIIISEATHVEWESIIKFIQVTKPKRVYLTHLNDNLELELNKKLKTLPDDVFGKIVLANDGLCLNL